MTLKKVGNLTLCTSPSTDPAPSVAVVSKRVHVELKVDCGIFMSEGISRRASYHISMLFRLQSSEKYLCSPGGINYKHNVFFYF